MWGSSAIGWRVHEASNESVTRVLEPITARGMQDATLPLIIGTGQCLNAATEDHSNTEEGPRRWHELLPADLAKQPNA